MSDKLARAQHTRNTHPARQDLSTSASAALISVCVAISRITGFARTWAMAFALGSTFLSSSYQVANNLPNQLYELVMGGMLVTAFLPVYVSIKKRLSEEDSTAYASNLLTIVVIFLGIIAAFCMLFPQLIVYTQTFYSDQESMSVAVLLFQFFAIQIVFYGASSIVSGLLNANREYFWSSIAPVANNLIVIATFLAYAALAPTNPTVALYVIAVGNPLGVAAQLFIQLPALRKRGIRLKPHVNLHDPALKETLALGGPTFLVMVCSFATVSVMNAASYCFAEDGPSVLAYARLWYTLPYSLLAIPVTTAMFTELSEMKAENNMPGVIAGITEGTTKILFLMIPFALYLIVFATPLVTLYHVGAFSDDSVSRIAWYLSFLALALPFYALSTYLQKVFSSLRRMGVYAALNGLAGVVQIALTAGAAWAKTAGIDIGIESIALASMAFYLVGDFVMFVYLKAKLGTVGLKTILSSCVRGGLLGFAGAAAGFGVLFALTSCIAPLSGSVLQAFAYTVVGGCVSLVVTFVPAVALKMPEAAFATSLVSRLVHRGCDDSGERENSREHENSSEHEESKGEQS